MISEEFHICSAWWFEKALKMFQGDQQCAPEGFRELQSCTLKYLELTYDFLERPETLPVINVTEI